jgi:hypothetical protein
MLRKRLTVIALATLLFVFALTVIACNKNKKTASLTLEQTEYSVEFGENFLLPAAVYRDKDGQIVEDAEITVKVYDEGGNEIAVNYGSFYPEIGVYKAQYTAADASATATITCRDTKSPTVTFSQFVSSTFAGDTYTIPNFTVTDLSGVVNSYTAVTLHKGDEEAAAATGKGATAVIEGGVSHYTLRIKVKDNAGNEETKSYTIGIITPFTDPNLAADLMFDFDEQEYLQNIADAANKPVLTKEIVTQNLPAANTDGDNIGAAGGALKLTVGGDTGGVAYLYRGREFQKDGVFAIYIRAWISSEVEYVHIKNAADLMTVRAFNNVDFTAGRWVDLEIKVGSFAGSAINSFAIEVGGGAGDYIYIDRVSIVNKVADPALAPNMLLDFDEASVYESGQVTVANKTVDGQTVNLLDILEEGDPDLPADTHGGALKIDAPDSGFWVETWLFQDYVTIADIGGLVLRIYLSEEFIRDNQVITVMIMDYNKRSIWGTWISNRVFRSNDWKPGWNDFTFYSAELALSDNDDAASYIHGLQIMGTAPYKWYKGGTLLIDEIRVLPKTYVDTSNFGAYTYNDEAYVNGVPADGLIPNTKPVENAAVEIVSESGASGKALKFTATAPNGKAELFFGPNMPLSFSPSYGARIKVKTAAANVLTLKAYDRRNQFVNEFRVNLTAGGFTAYDLTELYRAECEVYYFIASLQDAGTVFIDEIAKITGTRNRPAAANNEVLFSALGGDAAYSVHDLSVMNDIGGHRFTAMEFADGAVRLSFPYASTDENEYALYSVALSNYVTTASGGYLHINVKINSNVSHMYLSSNEIATLGDNPITVGAFAGDWIDYYLPVSGITSAAKFQGFKLGLRTVGAQSAGAELLYIKSVEYVSDRPSYTLNVTNGTANPASGLKWGDTVTLTHDDPAENKLFDFWKVNGVRIAGNTFVIYSNSTAEAVYKDYFADDYTDKYSGNGFANFGQSLADVMTYDRAAVPAGADGGGAMKFDSGPSFRGIRFAFGTSESYAEGKYVKIRIYFSSYPQAFYSGITTGENVNFSGCALNAWSDLYIPFSMVCAVGESSDGVNIGAGSNAGWPNYTFWIDEITVVTLSAHMITVSGEGGENASNADKATAYVGETVTLTRGTAPENRVFDYWTVNDVRITGDTFAMPNENVTVAAVYKDYFADDYTASFSFPGLWGFGALPVEYDRTTVPAGANNGGAMKIAAPQGFNMTSFALPAAEAYAVNKYVKIRMYFESKPQATYRANAGDNTNPGWINPDVDVAVGVWQDYYMAFTDICAPDGSISSVAIGTGHNFNGYTFWIDEITVVTLENPPG